MQLYEAMPVIQLLKEVFNLVNVKIITNLFSKDQVVDHIIIYVAK